MVSTVAAPNVFDLPPESLKEMQTALTQVLTEGKTLETFKDGELRYAIEFLPTESKVRAVEPNPRSFKDEMADFDYSVKPDVSLEQAAAKCFKDYGVLEDFAKGQLLVDQAPLQLPDRVQSELESLKAEYKEKSDPQVQRQLREELEPSAAKMLVALKQQREALNQEHLQIKGSTYDLQLLDDEQGVAIMQIRHADESKPPIYVLSEVGMTVSSGLTSKDVKQLSESFEKAAAHVKRVPAILQTASTKSRSADDGR